MRMSATTQRATVVILLCAWPCARSCTRDESGACIKKSKRPSPPTCTPSCSSSCGCDWDCSVRHCGQCRCETCAVCGGSEWSAHLLSPPPPSPSPLSLPRASACAAVWVAASRSLGLTGRLTRSSDVCGSSRLSPQGHARHRADAVRIVVRLQIRQRPLSSVRLSRVSLVRRRARDREAAPATPTAAAIAATAAAATQAYGRYALRPRL
jgi:hypothetical protein